MQVGQARKLWQCGSEGCASCDFSHNSSPDHRCLPGVWTISSLSLLASVILGRWTVPVIGF